jgi:lipoprotein-releasing system ATP-binding protein
MNPIVLKAEHIYKYFHDPFKVEALKDIHLEIHTGEFISITGKSGCGKSTLLYILSTMDTDYTGKIWIDGEYMTGKTEPELALVRNHKIGFVFQFHYLLNEFTVLRNVMLPGLKLNPLQEKEIEHRAMDLLKLLKIDHLAYKRANLISGGEKQRTAIARALINNPTLIMGDEPTGNLDKKNSDIVIDIFRQLSEELHKTLLIVTHDINFAEQTHRNIHMEDGRIITSPENKY